MTRFERVLATTIVVAACIGPVGAASAAALTSVPFRYLHHEIVVPVQIGDRAPCDMLLDTDTSPSAVGSAWLARLGLTTHGTAGVAQGVGSEKTRTFPVTIPTLRFGTITVRRLDALTTDLRPIATALHAPLCGVLGYSFLRDRVVQIDYPHHVVRILDDAPLEPFTATFTVGADDQLLVRDAFVGSRRVVATLDTGDGAFGNVTARGIRRLHAERAAARGARRSVRGYNGAAPVTAGTISGVRIGTLSMHAFPIVYNATDAAAYDLNVGNRLFERYTVTLDYQRDLLTVASPVNR